ncbi:hypothetical protein AHiyo6_15460, partial [Arthrobacter sp. Hiyo6]
MWLAQRAGGTAQLGPFGADGAERSVRAGAGISAWMPD